MSAPNLVALPGREPCSGPCVAIARSLVEICETQPIKAVAVVVLTEDGEAGHNYYTHNDLAALHFASAQMTDRLLRHGTQDPWDGEWDAESWPFDEGEE